MKKKKKIIIDENFLLKDENFILNKAPLNYLYGKNIFFTNDFSNDRSFFFQIVGNLGAYANDYKIDNSIDIFILSDLIFNNFKNGIKEDILVILEKKLNSKGHPLKDLVIITESTLIDFVKKRILHCNDIVTQHLLNLL